MSALSAARNTPQMGLGVPKLMSYPQKTGVTIYDGSLVVLGSDGYAKPGVSETGDIPVGRAVLFGGATSQGNSGSSGAVSVQVEQGVFKWDVNGTAIAVTNINSLAYVYDDHTVTLSSSSASIAGTIYGFDSDGGCWVYTGLASPIDSSSVTTISNTLAALKTNLVVPWTCPVVLSSAVTSAVVGRFTPGMSGTILKTAAQVIVPATTTSKLATLAPLISAVAVTGGAIALTSTNCATLGAQVTGTAVTGSNTFTASQEITVTASSVTAFVEGQVLLELFLQTA